MPFCSVVRRTSFICGPQPHRRCKALFSGAPKARILNDARGLIKMVIDAKSRKVMGVEITSSNAADIIHEAAFAIRSGLTIDDIIGTVHVFPTLSESIKPVAQSSYRDITKLSCCTE